MQFAKSLIILYLISSNCINASLKYNQERVTENCEWKTTESWIFFFLQSEKLDNWVYFCTFYSTDYSCETEETVLCMTEHTTDTFRAQYHRVHIDGHQFHSPHSTELILQGWVCLSHIEGKGKIESKFVGIKQVERANAAWISNTIIAICRNRWRCYDNQSQKWCGQPSR